jgi:Raf kinase inhibitor-like YbhB/YbcL family protein
MDKKSNIIMAALMGGALIMPMKMISTAFQDGGFMPTKYTCEGSDISPALKWQNIPKATKSLVLMCEDPDAPNGLWTHWLLYNIPPSILELQEKAGGYLPPGAEAGLNSWQRQDYGGPCPPKGVHHYIFTLYALDSALSFAAPPNNQKLHETIKDHILAKTTYVGLYEKKNLSPSKL